MRTSFSDLSLLSKKYPKLIYTILFLSFILIGYYFLILDSNVNSNSKFVQEQIDNAENAKKIEYLVSFSNGKSFNLNKALYTQKLTVTPKKLENVYNNCLLYQIDKNLLLFRNSTNEMSRYDFSTQKWENESIGLTLSGLNAYYMDLSKHIPLTKSYVYSNYVYFDFFERKGDKIIFPVVTKGGVFSNKTFIPTKDIFSDSLKNLSLSHKIIFSENELFWRASKNKIYIFPYQYADKIREKDSILIDDSEEIIDWVNPAQDKLYLLTRSKKGSEVQLLLYEKNKSYKFLKVVKTDVALSYYTEIGFCKDYIVLLSAEGKKPEATVMVIPIEGRKLNHKTKKIICPAGKELTKSFDFNENTIWIGLTNEHDAMHKLLIKASEKDSIVIAASTIPKQYASTYVPFYTDNSVNFLSWQNSKISFGLHKFSYANDLFVPVPNDTADLEMAKKYEHTYMFATSWNNSANAANPNLMELLSVMEADLAYIHLQKNKEGKYDEKVIKINWGELGSKFTVISEPNIFVNILYVFFSISFYSLGLILIQDLSEKKIEQPDNLPLDIIPSLKYKINNFYITARNLRWRSDIMLFLGVVFGVGGVASFFVVLSKSLEGDNLYAWDADTLIDLLRPTVLLVFIETFTFFFLKQYKIIFNEYKLFYSLYTRLYNYIHVLELTQSDKISEENKSKLTEQFFKENYEMYETGTKTQINEFDNSSLIKMIDALSAKMDKLNPQG